MSDEETDKTKWLRVGGVIEMLEDMPVEKPLEDMIDAAEANGWFLGVGFAEWPAADEDDSDIDYMFWKLISLAYRGTRRILKLIQEKNIPEAKKLAREISDELEKHLKESKKQE